MPRMYCSAASNCSILFRELNERSLILAHLVLIAKREMYILLLINKQQAYGKQIIEVIPCS